VLALLPSASRFFVRFQTDTPRYAITAAGSVREAIDAKRGIKSRLVFLERAATMSSFNGSAVTDPADPKQNKNAIDAIFRKANPEYLMILGAIDVVPHQDIKNPAFDPPDDPDPNADGDQLVNRNDALRFQLLRNNLFVEIAQGDAEVVDRSGGLRIAERHVPTAGKVQSH
jgi:hypothetical protein